MRIESAGSTRASVRLVVLLLSTTFFLAAPTYAQPSPVSSTWLAGPDATGSSSLGGAIDQLSPGAPPSQLTGWVVDTTAQGWTGIDDVQIWDGLMNGSGHQLARARIQISRPDVAAALSNPYWEPSGFAATLSTGSSANLVVYVYAHTPSKGWWYQLVVRGGAAAQTAPAPRLQIDSPNSLATVHANAPYTAHGIAFDPAASPDQGTGVDRVQLYLNGDRGSGTYIGDATLGLPDQSAAAAGGQFANAGWQLKFQPNSWLEIGSDNQLTPLTVYAHSSVTGSEAQTRTTIVISVP